MISLALECFIPEDDQQPDQNTLEVGRKLSRTDIEMLQEVLIKGCRGKRRPFSTATSKKQTIFGT